MSATSVGTSRLNYLIDTNIISEVRKGAKCDRTVAAWYDSILDSGIYLSALVLGEIRKGIERARVKGPAQHALEKWLMDVVGSFGERIVPVDHAVADEWGGAIVRELDRRAFYRRSAIDVAPMASALPRATMMGLFHVAAIRSSVTRATDVVRPKCMEDACPPQYHYHCDLGKRKPAPSANFITLPRS